MYKIGFTRWQSIDERFIYNKLKDGESIESRLLFIHLHDAYSVEQALHNHFSSARAFGKFSSLAHMPLFNNGQSELYTEDVLGLDATYSRKTSKATKSNIRRHQASLQSNSTLYIFWKVHMEEFFAKMLGIAIGAMFSAILIPFLFLFSLIENERDKSTIKPYKDSRESIEELLKRIGANTISGTRT